MKARSRYEDSQSTVALAADESREARRRQRRQPEGAGVWRVSVAYLLLKVFPVCFNEASAYLAIIE